MPEQVIKANRFFNTQVFEGPVIIADGVQTPDNLGAIFRLAGNIGCPKVVLTERSSLSSIKVEKIARNSLQYIQIVQMTYQEIQAHFPVLLAVETSSDAQNIYQTKLPKELAIVVGNERFGIAPEMIEFCTIQTYIPMPGNVKSLNVSHALSIALFEWYRQNFE
ncbi:MAG: TrmH family RNA methyltransferase [Bacteroidales bacterium]|nr:TrmH family RNA methyltransferase [Bacteroidales bacterium]